MYKMLWPRKSIKVGMDFWVYFLTRPITIKWKEQHPSNNTDVQALHYNWLVVSSPLKTMSSSVGVNIPNIWKNEKIMFQTTNQIMCMTQQRSS